MSEQEFEAYLRLLGRFLRLDEHQRKTIGRELRGHMEERLDELLSRGYTREDAVNTVLDEFGDAAALAGEFGRPSRRKWIVRGTAGTIGIAASFLLVMFLMPENRPISAPENSFAQAAAFSGAPASRPVTKTAVVGRTAAAEPAVAVALAASRESQADRRLREQLGQAISIDLPEGTTLKDALEVMAESGRVPIVANWNAMSKFGVDSTTDSLGLRLSGVPLSTALELLLQNASGEAALDYAIMNGVIRVSTSEALAEQIVLRVYDCSDLIRRPSGAELSAWFKSQFGGGGMGGMGGMMSGMGGYGGGGGCEGDQPKVEDTLYASILGSAGDFYVRLERERAQHLLKLIAGTVQPGSWSLEGRGAVGAISEYSGLLVVSHNAKAQQQVAELLSLMRRALAERPEDQPSTTALPTGFRGEGGFGAPAGAGMFSPMTAAMPRGPDNVPASRPSLGGR